MPKVIVTPVNPEHYSVDNSEFCHNCGKQLLGCSGLFRPHVLMLRPMFYETSGQVQNGPYTTMASGQYADYYCTDCIGFKSGGSLHTRQDWIRDNLPEYIITRNSPPDIVADWLMDQNRVADADYMRNLCSD